MKPKRVQLNVDYIFQQAAAEDQLSVEEYTPTPHVLSSPPSLSLASVGPPGFSSVRNFWSFSLRGSKL